MDASEQIENAIMSNKVSDEERENWNNFINSLFDCVKQKRILENRKQIKIVK